MQSDNAPSPVVANSSTRARWFLSAVCASAPSKNSICNATCGDEQLLVPDPQGKFYLCPEPTTENPSVASNHEADSLVIRVKPRQLTQLSKASNDFL
jgi:hypothetical protein